MTCHNTEKMFKQLEKIKRVLGRPECRDQSALIKFHTKFIKKYVIAFFILIKID